MKNITEEIKEANENHEALLEICRKVTGNDLPKTHNAAIFFEIRGLYNRGKIGGCQMVTSLKNAAREL